MATVTNVSAGKPAVGGAIYMAATNASMPTAVDSTLTGFTCLGYVSEDGLVNSNSPSAETIKAWGGDPVLVTSNERPDTFQFTLLEALNADVLKLVYGADNVSGALATGITVHANNAEQDEYAFVIDMVMRGGAQKRIVIPDAMVSEIGDITYTDGEAVGYEVTIAAMPVTLNGKTDTHFEFIKAASTT